MKERSLIFILALAFLGNISCQDEPEEPLSGTWDIHWTNEYGELDGLITFEGTVAVLTAFGDDSSAFLHEYSEKRFTWSFHAGELTLISTDRSVDLHYTLLRQHADYLEFDHLDGISVILKKRYP